MRIAAGEGSLRDNGACSRRSQATSKIAEKTGRPRERSHPDRVAREGAGASHQPAISGEQRWQTHAKRKSLRKAWKTRPAAPARGLPNRPAVWDKPQPSRRHVSGKLRLKPERKWLGQVLICSSKTPRRYRTPGASAWTWRPRSWAGLRSNLVARSACQGTGSNRQPNGRPATPKPY